MNCRIAINKLKITNSLLILFLIFITFANKSIYTDEPNLENSTPEELQKEEKISDEDNSDSNSEEEFTDPETVISPVEKIINLSNQYYKDFLKNKNANFPNENMERLHQFAITYNEISREIFSREVIRLPSQRKIPDLIDYSLKGNWFHLVSKWTGDPIYSYSESRALQIFITTHTVAQSYEIPFPTFYCLLYQESQFDFKVRSHTGAVGIGQLTGIAIKQLQKNRKLSKIEKKLQSTISDLKNIYEDPIFNEVLTEMGFNHEFPTIDKFPKNIVTARKLNTSLSRDISKKLIKKGYKFGKNYKLVQKLTSQISRGRLLPKKYASMHSIYLESLNNAKNNLGNTLNIETNILLSGMLLRYYMDYSWKVNGKKINLTPEVKAIVAIAAYNQGPGVVQRYFSQFKRNYPKKNLSKMTIPDFQKTFTYRRVANALRQSPSQAKELFKHIWKVKSCSHGK